MLPKAISRAGGDPIPQLGVKRDLSVVFWDDSNVQRSLIFHMRSNSLQPLESALSAAAPRISTLGGTLERFLKLLLGPPFVPTVPRQELAFESGAGCE